MNNNLDNSTTEIKVQLNVLSTSPDPAEKRRAAHNIAQALILQRDHIQKIVDGCAVDSQYHADHRKIVRHLNREIDFFRRLQHKFNVGPDGYNEDWQRLPELDTQVGYCKPPRQHQFKPGNPGGPGRPKGVYSLRARIIDELVKKNGRKTRSIVNALVKKATAGDVKAIVAVWKMTEPKRKRRNPV